MYIPPAYEVTDWDEITSFVSQARAGEFVTVNRDGTPEASTLPFTWYPVRPETNSADKSFGRATTHMARTNPQWKDIENGAPALIIVHAPGAYISPTNYAKTYETGKAVGTWDYQVVHLRGTVEVLHDPSELMQIVSDLQRDHEASREYPWDLASADQNFLHELIKHVVGFTVNITSVEAKYKLDQKESMADRSKIVADLEMSKSVGEKHIAREMQRLFKLSS
jgi:transcriptional regulator